MGRRIEPVCRLCRREGIKLFLKGIRCSGDKCAIERSNQPPGMHGGTRRLKLSDYGMQLREKQKTKKIYGLLERQFRVFFSRAARKRGVTGEMLISLLERRLDNVLYRLLFVSSRAEARQLVNHGNVLVNGRLVNIVSYLVKPGDKIELKKKESLINRVKANLEMLQDRSIPGWLVLDKDLLEAKVERMPTKADAGLPVEESLIIELYSK
ncbi:MAG: 30S ribosomal protein S4 [Candidatus Omnitrophica bacterium]|nr:30S ribosomal protein S4 [Candidatus Omnitrophota bacterium]